MLQDLKNVLDNLSAALFELQNKVAEVDKAKGEYIISKMKQGELQASLKAKVQELDARETKIAGIESIAEFSEAAKRTMAEAKTLIKNTEEKQTMLDKGLKKLAEDKGKLEIEYQDKNAVLKKQAEALKEERKTLDEKIKVYKSVMK
jgi:DNA repair exonuclease SbcCD ATPase subunit